MRFSPKALPLVLQNLDRNWRLSHWSCFPTYILYPTLVSSILEEHNFCVIWSKELKLTFVHIFQTMGKTVGRSAARMCLPFYSLVMKIMLLKGVHPPKEGTILVCQWPISMMSLQMSKSHSSAERAEQSPSKEQLLLTCHSFQTTISCSNYPLASRDCISSHSWGAIH